MSTSVATNRITGFRKLSSAGERYLSSPSFLRTITSFLPIEPLDLTGNVECSNLTNKCCCKILFKFTKRMSNLVFLTILLLLTNCSRGYTASIRIPKDQGDIIDLDHEYLTFHSYHNNSDVIDTIQYYFRLDKGDNYVPLRRNQGIDLKSPLCFIDSSTNKLICESSSQQNVNFYHDDDHTVAVAISNENGTMKLRGIVNSENHTHELKPLESDDLPINRYHVIKKRWTANMVRKSARPYQPYRGRPNTKSKPKYKKIPDWEKKDTGYCIDVLCVVDYSIYKKFKASEKTDSKAMEKIRYYYAHVINGINMRYSTIAQKDLSINVRLAGYFIAKKATDLPFIDSVKMENNPGYRVDSNYTLTELDSFLKRNQRKQTLPDYNHAMLFLEYASTNLGGSVLGTSFVSGICSDSKSTSLVVDHGAYTSAGIGTHELGHNLGVYWHDGEGTARGSKCNSSLNYIMAPASYLIDERNLKYSFTFSQCSTDQIKSNLDNLMTKNKNCLQCSARDRNSRTDVLIDKEVNGHMEILPGQVDDVHIQCKQLYGDRSFMCPPASPDEMCYRMYCYDPKRSACAIISEQMAAPGTPCGKYKVCKMGKCVSDTTNGKNVPDDCPYPDIPSYGAHCEDATPFMCKNEKFRQKCCNSCSKQFTAEEACKDSHILINGMTCSQLMVSVYGRPGCASDYNVKNMCCLSCKKLLGTGSSSPAGVMIHIGIGTGSGNPSINGQFAQNFRSLSSRGNSISNRITNTMTNSPSSNRNMSPPYQVPYKSKQQSLPKNASPKTPSGCTDNSWLKINGMTCNEIGVKALNLCNLCNVRKACCKSCSKLKSRNKC
ncbi:hypothetical protein ACF0H5_023549 [Mactra antiquata]